MQKVVQSSSLSSHLWWCFCCLPQALVNLLISVSYTDSEKKLIYIHSQLLFLYNKRNQKRCWKMPIGVLETALLFLCWLFSSLHNQFFNSWISRLNVPFVCTHELNTRSRCYRKKWSSSNRFFFFSYQDFLATQEKNLALKAAGCCVRWKEKFSWFNHLSSFTFSRRTA